MTDEEKIIFFEKHYEEIEQEIEKRRRKWQLRGVLMIEFDDVKNIVINHIYRKLHLYDESQPLLNWINTIATNQISNILRNNYYNHSRPCIQMGGCSFNDGNELCSYTPSGNQCEECPLFAVWAKSKKHANDIKMSLPMENHLTEIFDIPNTNSDLNNSIDEMHSKMEKHLKIFEFRVYKYLYILGLSEEETARRMGYKKSTDPFRKRGYNSILKIKKTIVKTAKKLIEKGEIDIL